MCLIVYKNAEAYIGYEEMERMAMANPDGFGLMWADGDRIHIIKWCFDHELFGDIYQQIDDYHFGASIAIHFRTASSSSIGYDYCHPFFVNENLAFMANGNLFEFQSYFGKGFKDKKTDTQRFNEQILRRLPGGFLENQEIRSALEEYCRANFTKLLFMDNFGTVTIINEDAGEWNGGIWYSNGGIQNYIGYGYSGAYYYHENDVRHRGGVSTSMVFSPDRRSHWQPCSRCLGNFKKEALSGGLCGGCRQLVRLEGFCL